MYARGTGVSVFFAGDELILNRSLYVHNIVSADNFTEYLGDE